MLSCMLCVDVLSRYSFFELMGNEFLKLVCEKQELCELALEASARMS